MTATGTVFVTNAKDARLPAMRAIGMKEPLPTKWSGARELDYSIAHHFEGKATLRFMQMGGSPQDVKDTKEFFKGLDTEVGGQTIVFDLGQLLDARKTLAGTVKHDYIKALGLSLLTENNKKQALETLKTFLAEGGILVEDSGGSTHPPTITVWAKAEGTMHVMTEGNLYDMH